MSTNIYVGNLSYNMSDNDLVDLFGQYGEVESAKTVIDRETGRSKGFAFVVMPSEEAAENAINELNGQEIDGRGIRVNIARPREY